MNREGTVTMKTKTPTGKRLPRWKEFLLLPACVLFLILANQADRGQAQTGAATGNSPAPVAVAGARPNDIAGIWQGTMHIPQANRDLRIEIKIVEVEGGAYKTTFYNIDQNGMSTVASKTTFADGALTFTIDMVGGKYEGKMNADHATIQGAWTQGAGSIALNLARTTPEDAWPIPEQLKPMAADADPAFDVATIKTNNSGAMQMQALVIDGRRFKTRASSLNDLIAFAYRVQLKQIAGGSAWTTNERYDIEALPDVEGVPNTEQIQGMIRKLLADRFHLTFHHETREMSAYTLEIAKGGQKMTSNESNSTLPGLFFSPEKGGVALRVRNATMGDFADFLQFVVLDKPVVEHTQLSGRFDFKCTFSPDDSQFNGHPPIAAGADGMAMTDAASAPNLYKALQEQLGLKLSAGKTGVEVIVIDRVEKPSPN
jgi:uncharacterized protein (TIGR03435 family)